MIVIVGANSFFFCFRAGNAVRYVKIFQDYKLCVLGLC